MTRKRNVVILLLTVSLSLVFCLVGCRTVGLDESDGGSSRGSVSARGGNRIRLEHVAVNVADPVKMARWYTENLGMTVMREGPAPANMRFLADGAGNMMLELYHNPPDAVPNYAAMDPLLLHVAFMVDDVDAIRRKLIAAGATPVGEVVVTPAGDRLAMLRDPWGLAIQFVRRADPMVAHD